MSIRLHSKHGVNPTIVQCFFCGQDKNELALLGAAYRTEAPRHMVMDYEPCDTCKSNMALGITLIECSEHSPDQRREIQRGLYPTGSWCVVKEEAAKKIFQPEELLLNVLKHRKAFIEVGVLEKLGAPKVET